MHFNPTPLVRSMSNGLSPCLPQCTACSFSLRWSELSAVGVPAHPLPKVSPEPTALAKSVPTDAKIFARRRRLRSRRRRGTSTSPHKMSNRRTPRSRLGRGLAHRLLGRNAHRLGWHALLVLQHLDLSLPLQEILKIEGVLGLRRLRNQQSHRRGRPRLRRNSRDMLRPSLLGKRAMQVSKLLSGLVSLLRQVLLLP